MELGRSYIKQGKHKEAETVYEVALSLGRDQSLVYYGLAEYYFSLGRYTETTDAMKKAMELNPKITGWIEAYVEQEENFIEHGQHEGVEDINDGAATLGRHRNFVYEDLDEYFDAFGRYAEELEAFKKAMELNPNITNVEKLAGFYIQQNNFEESLEILFDAIKFWPGESYFYQLQVKSYEFQNKYDAKFILKFLREIETDNPELKENEIVQDYISFFEDKSRMQDKIEDWLKQDLEEIVHLCKSNNIQLIIQNYPYPYHSVNRLLGEVADKCSLPFVDNRAVFKGLAPYGKYFMDSDHNTAEGHKVVAGNVYSLLTAQ